MYTNVHFSKLADAIEAKLAINTDIDADLVEQIRYGVTILRKGRVSNEEEKRFGDDICNEYADIVYLIKHPKEISTLMFDYNVED